MTLEPEPAAKEPEVGPECRCGSRFADEERREEQGGDPACWLSRVCPGCGAFIEQESAASCPRCAQPVH